MVQSSEDSVEIDAPPPAVMAVLSDVASYPRWASSVQQVEVVDPGGVPDRPRRVRFVVSAGPLTDDYTLDYDWHEQNVSWQLVAGTLQRSQTGSYDLAPRAAGTLVTYRLAVELAVPLPGLFRRQAERTVMRTALVALKDRVESLR